MNLIEVVSPVARLAFQAWRRLVVVLPGGRVRSFGSGSGQISRILVINLDRHPRRWERVGRELDRFRTSAGAALTSIAQRLEAVDARDGRAVAATADVDVMYRVGDQLHVQPDSRLAQCFAPEEPVRMTRQEVAVARSHIEAWKAVATGADDFVLVLEDDIWFKPGAPAAIDRGWSAARQRCSSTGGPSLLYLSYSDADGTAERADEGERVFRPVRGIWHLSGYVISRGGAVALLESMPVIGPVDLWMNYRFGQLAALALNKPAIAQRLDEESSNAYSILPYLARAGVVDSDHGLEAPAPTQGRPVLAWTDATENESLPMALSMLGLRVCVFDGDEEPLDESSLGLALQSFDALIDVPLEPAAMEAATNDGRCVILVETDVRLPVGLADHERFATQLTLPTSNSADDDWDVLCDLLSLEPPIGVFPVGVPRSFGLFRGARPLAPHASAGLMRARAWPMDDSPWVLPPSSGWMPAPNARNVAPLPGAPIADAPMTEASPAFPGLRETFPGNLAAFEPDGLSYGAEGARLEVDVLADGVRPYRSGAFASSESFRFGLSEVEIRAARGSGIVTGFFLHRDTPRQEIDVELAGADPQRLLVNVFFNPGDDGTAMDYGFRGSPFWVDLGFDATATFHRYAIDWRPDRVVWLVDGRVVHERVSWDPTPIPHLSMRLHCNLWVPRSDDFAGRLDESALPATASFRNISIRRQA